MAQALFDEHPLEKYLREAGETSELMPGISSELELEIDTMRDFYAASAEEGDGNEDMEWCPHVLLQVFEILQNAISSTQSPSAPNPFVEHFKYNVISSSLLASALPSPQSPRRKSTSTSIPGKLSHSRTSSAVSDRPDASAYLAPAEPPYGIISVSALSFAASFSAGYPIIAFISSIVTLILMYNFIVMTETPKNDITPSLDALDDLLAANTVWESVVQEAVSALETEERSTLYSPATPSLSSSSVRVALHSTLQTTQTQCDNIRHLFSALTSPSELSQLSEMYAPPSPVRSSSSSSTFDSSSRPSSFQSQHRVNSAPTTPPSKRSTWNGSYSSLAFAGSPTNNIFRRREKHRSNLSTLLQSGSGLSSSAPVTPVSSSPGNKLSRVTEDHGVAEEDNSSTRSSQETRPFGAAALDLQRKHRSGGMEAFQMPPENYFTSDLQSPRSNRMNPSTSSASRFTTLQTPRHPLSLSALHHALQAALASKRYACSHLLALRFSGEEDEGYWEDVRSVMGLLTSTFADASLRLSEALEELDSAMLREQNPTPGLESSFENGHSRTGSNGEGQDAKRRRTDSISFAPMPSHISRFAAHVAAINSALDDAREHLDQCVAALKEDPTSTPSTRSLRHSRSLTHLMEAVVEDPPALQAYERLRRELGLALRECERGRGKLLDLVNPPNPSDEGDDSDGVPGLGHDMSDDSDKPDPTSPSEDEGDPIRNAGLTVVNPDAGEVALDDATQHLLLATSTAHLPPPGVEQVFEADTGGGVVFSRERSKLTREERIKIAKTRRESGGGGIGLGLFTDSPVSEKRGIEKWGPGGEVVQELKDVIWKVGEQRRKMADGLPQAEL